MQTYEHYKHSGIDWLGEIPSHWECERLKSFTSFVNRGATPTYVELSNYFVINQANFSKGYFDRANIKYTKSGEKEYIESKGRVYKDDLLIASTGGGVLGKVYHFTEEGSFIADSHVTIVRADLSKGINKYLYYFLSINFNLINGVLAQGSTNQTELQRNWLLDFRFPLPPLQEQQAIAAFLDEKCEKIDALVAMKQQQIEKLKELRQAKIHQAVTKGISDTEGSGSVEMKDSGIDWIGQIPKHWEVKRLKNLFNLIGGGTPSKDNVNYWNGNIPWVSPKDMKSLFIEETEDYITNEAISQSSTKLIKKGSLLVVVRSGILQRTIPICFANVDLTINQDIKAISPNGDMTSSFLYYYIAGNEKFLLKEWVKEGATVESIEVPYLLNSELTIPPLAEQQQIVNYLEEVTTKIDQAIAQKQAQIEQLKAYKQSLINEVVTGKVKVSA